MYLPIFKNRDTENRFLRDHKYFFSNNNINPLIEIIQVNKKYSKVEDIINHYNELLESNFFIDFFTFDEKEYHPFKYESVEFSIKLRSESEYNYLELLKSVASFENAIPVISINSGREFILDKNYLENIIIELQRVTSKIAIRIKAKYFDDYFSIIDNKLRETDYFMYDISEDIIEPYILDIFKIQNRNCKSKTIVINSPRKRKVYNNKYPDGKFTHLINNDLKISYSNYGFDGFGDYAGYKDSLPTSGGDGRGAALSLFYVENENKFFSIKNSDNSLGHRGYEYVKNKVLYDYKKFLDPNNDCPAIKYIEKFNQKGSNGNWATWIYITFLRYISQIKKSTSS